MKALSIIVGIIASTLSIEIIVSNCPQHGYSPFTTNKFLNIMLILIVLEIAIIFTECTADSTAREIGFDSILAIIDAYATYKINIFKDNTILFSGECTSSQIELRLFIPILFITAWSGLNGSTYVTSKLAAHKLKKVG